MLITNLVCICREIRKNLETKAKHNPQSLHLTSICTLVNILQDTYFFNKQGIILHANPHSWHWYNTRLHYERPHTQSF